MNLDFNHPWQNDDRFFMNIFCVNDNGIDNSNVKTIFKSFDNARWRKMLNSQENKQKKSSNNNGIYILW